MCRCDSLTRTRANHSRVPPGSTILVVMRQLAAKRHRPSRLRPVEPGLRAPPPRTVMYYHKSGSPLARQRFRSTTAVKGWVFRVKVDDSHPEGPAFTIDFAFEDDGKLNTARVNCEYDEYHWRAGAPDYYRWFQRRIEVGEQVTVLLGADRDPCIFGMLEPFERCLYGEVLQQAHDCDDDDARHALEDRLIEILYQAGHDDRGELLRKAFRPTALRNWDPFDSLRELATMWRTRGTVLDVLDKLALRDIRPLGRLFWAAE